LSGRARNLARRLRDLKDEHTDVMDRRAVYAHDVNRACNALLSYGKVKERVESSRPTIETPNPQEPPPPERNQESPDPDQILEEVEKDADPQRPEAPPWAKKAYRQVVQLTHPDKLNQNEELTDAQIERMSSLYLEATEAFKTGKWHELLEVVAELDIDVEADPKMMEEAFSSKIKELTEAISKVHSSVAWVWGNSFGDMDKRVNVLARCCQIMKIDTPPKPALEEIVKELEENLEFDIVNKLGHVKRLKVEATRRKIGSRPTKKIR
jgi:hypothetical protein